MVSGSPEEFIEALYTTRVFPVTHSDKTSLCISFPGEIASQWRRLVVCIRYEVSALLSVRPASWTEPHEKRQLAKPSLGEGVKGVGGVRGHAG